MTTESHSNANFGHLINDVIDYDQVFNSIYVLHFFKLECCIVTTLNAYFHKTNIVPQKEGSHFQLITLILMEVRPGSKNIDKYRNFKTDTLRTFKANIFCILLR